MKFSGFVFLIVIFGSSTGVPSTNNDCENPPVFSNAQAAVTLENGIYPHGTTLNYNCLIGYVGRLRYMCDDGNWKNTNRRFYCKLKPCGSPGDTLHATFHLIRGEDLVFGARIEYICDEGYQLVATKNYRDCEVDGWSGLVPYCEVQTCPSVKEPENVEVIMSGTFDLDQDFPFGSALQFECSSSELEIEGVKEIYCLANGTWSNPVPSCKELICSTPTILHGQVLSNERVFKYSEQLKYKCDRNYRPENIQQTACNKFGWIPQPTCTPIVCHLPRIEHGNFQNRKWMYGHGEELKYTCQKNYKPEHEGTARCQASGWFPNPSCVEIRCMRPNVVTDIHPSHQLYSGTQEINYYCRSSNIWKQSTCTEGGWSPAITCPGPCSAPPSIANGRFPYTRNAFPSDWKASYQCNNNFKLQGKGEIKCINAEWFITDSIPVCITTGCRKPPQLLNGRFEPEQEIYSQRQPLVYRCNHGYQLHGSSTVYCGPSWPGTPICSDLQLRCPHLPEVDNGKIRTQNTYHDHAYYNCDRGYIMEGSEKIQCINGKWSEAPKCNPHPGPNLYCDRPPVIDNGGTTSLTRFEYAHNHRVIYKCHDSCVMEGKAEVTCFRGKWSTVPRCLAPCLISEEDFRKNEIILLWSFQKPINMKHGERLIFSCPDGFYLEPPAERFCNNGHMEFPKCLSEESKTCTGLQYSECSACTRSEICVQYHIKKVEILPSDASTLSLMAKSGSGNAIFTVQHTHKSSRNNLKFSIKESSNAVVNVAFNREPRGIQYNNPAIGDYCLTFPKDNSITFNVTFSKTFTIRFDRLKQNVE
ncbi:complement factor H-like [Scyliorhinus canicula]|uniref:complement factor H-like n=1 Tax=Scyliorhinus canicula TaxID=7830 RepID=UPI0018F4DCD1|nr:complement factor H-like [Scyliorhinus canicula]